MTGPRPLRIAAVAVALLSAAACGGVGGDRDEIVVFAASSLTNVAEKLTAAHEAAGGSPVQLVVGGSAALAAQLRDGAPADVFLSADGRRADEVAATCAAGCPVAAFATNSLVLAAAAGNPGEVTGLADLQRPELRIVMCAETVPCGALGDELTAAHDLSPAVDSFESSVRGVRSRLELGEADVGLIYGTDVTAAIDVVAVDGIDEFTTTYHHVALAAGSDDRVTALLRFIDGPDGQRILAELGFGPVGS